MGGPYIADLWIRPEILDGMKGDLLFCGLLFQPLDNRITSRNWIFMTFLRL